MNMSNKCLSLLLVLFPLILSAQIGEEQGKNQRLKLIFVGDIMGHGPQIRSAEIIKDSLYDYDACFEWVTPILKEADLAIGNLEVTLPGTAPYQGYPQFRSPDDLALALRYAGFDFLVTANNHSNDSGKTGLINTIYTLDEYGFYHTGTFQNEAEKRAYYPLIIYKNNFKLAFLNYTYDTNGIPTRKPTVVNLIDENQIKEDLKIAEQFKPDATIVIMHWGDEYQLNENEKQSKLAAKMAEWGADLIIGAHPHVVQPIKEIINDQKKVLVAYSLGNFISAQTKANTDGGIMLEVELEKNIETGLTSVFDHHFITVWRHIERNEKGKTKFVVLPASALENETEAEMIKLNNSNAKKT